METVTPRAISKILFNTEAQHPQIRVRLLKEALQNHDKYLNNEYLRIGVDHLFNVDLVQHYSEYSDQYRSSMTLNDVTMREIYRREVFSYRLLGAYSGVYQLHATTTILNSIVISHYPSTTIESIHKDLDRPFYPVSYNGSGNLKTCHIQWTKSGEKLIRLEHFVPLVRKE